MALDRRRSARFALAMASVGAAGGAAGHFLFVHVLRGSLDQRAAQVGWIAGLGTAFGAWSAAWFGRDVIVPFEPGPERDRVIRNALPAALISGPAAGVLVSRLVIRRLRTRFGG